MKLAKFAAAILSAAIVSACAEGTTVVTGQQRPAINPEQVKLYSQPPQSSYEVIGLVRASSGNGWTDQQPIDYAVTELKKQAAKVGANGVVIGSTGAQTGGFVMIDNVAYPYDEQTVSGTAVFVN